MSNAAALTWGHPQSEWDAAKAEAQTIMIEIARHRGRAGTITYRSLTDRIGSIRFDPRGHDFRGLLGQVATAEDEAGRGLLSAVIVLQEYTKIPGAGFFELAVQRKRSFIDKEIFWAEELARVQEYWRHH
jgi:hypothetical protein